MSAGAVERRTLAVVLAINAAMCVVELGVGWIAQSMGLIADSLDMLADGRSVELTTTQARQSEPSRAILVIAILVETRRTAMSIRSVRVVALLAVVSGYACSLPGLLKKNLRAIEASTETITRNNEVVKQSTS